MATTVFSSCAASLTKVRSRSKAELSLRTSASNANARGRSSETRLTFDDKERLQFLSVIAEACVASSPSGIIPLVTENQAMRHADVIQNRLPRTANVVIR